MKKKSDIRRPVNLTMHPEIIKKLDAQAAEMSMTRSSFVEWMVRFIDVMSSNEEFQNVVKSLIIGAQAVKPAHRSVKKKPV